MSCQNKGRCGEMIFFSRECFATWLYSIHVYNFFIFESVSSRCQCIACIWVEILEVQVNNLKPSFTRFIDELDNIPYRINKAQIPGTGLHCGSKYMYTKVYLERKVTCQLKQDFSETVRAGLM